MNKMKKFLQVENIYKTYNVYQLFHSSDMKKFILIICLFCIYLIKKQIFIPYKN